MKFSIKDFFSKLDQIRSFRRICSHLLEKSLLQNVGFSAMFEYSYLLPCTADQENSILGLFQEVLSFVLFTFLKYSIPWSELFAVIIACSQ